MKTGNKSLIIEEGKYGKLLEIDLNWSGKLFLRSDI